MENNTSDIEAIEINGSNSTDTFIDDPRFFYTTTQKILVALPLCMIALVVVCGNLLVVIAVLSKRYLRTPQNMYFLSLAFVDFLVGIFVLPMNIMNQLHGWRFPLRKAFCKFYVTTDFVLCASSIYHLLAVAEDRYRIVSQGVQYIHDRSLTDVVAKLMIIYVLSLWIASGPLLGWAGDTWLTTYETDRWCSMLDNRYFAFFASFGCFWFPAIIMLFYYVRIYNSIAGRLRVRRPTIVADQQSHSSDVLGTGSTSSRSTKNAVKPEVDRKRSSVSIYVKDFLATKRKFSLSRERKTAKTLGIVVGAFIACWLPFTLLLNTYMINPDLPFIGQIGFEVITWLGYVNSALNPIIYTVFNQEFRQAFKEILYLK